MFTRMRMVSCNMTVKIRLNEWRYETVTIEDLDLMYVDKEKDAYYLYMQAVLGSREEAARAYDAEGNFHCIGWFNCLYCPAFDSRYCL